MAQEKVLQLNHSNVRSLCMPINKEQLFQLLNNFDKKSDKAEEKYPQSPTLS